jgi:hypothetical protein
MGLNFVGIQSGRLLREKHVVAILTQDAFTAFALRQRKTKNLHVEIA